MNEPEDIAETTLARDGMRQGLAMAQERITALEADKRRLEAENAKLRQQVRRLQDTPMAVLDDHEVCDREAESLREEIERLRGVVRDLRAARPKLNVGALIDPSKQRPKP